jgi:hypothetical protein
MSAMMDLNGSAPGSERHNSPFVKTIHLDRSENGRRRSMILIDAKISTFSKGKGSRQIRILEILIHFLNAQPREAPLVIVKPAQGAG